MADTELREEPVAEGQEEVQAPREDEKSGLFSTLRGRLNAEAAIVLFAIPVIVAVGFGSYLLWHATANLDSVEQSALAWSKIGTQIWEHLKLTFVSAFFVVVIAVPLGIMLTRGRARVAAPLVVGFANAGQAAPAVGLIVLFQMWLSPGFRTAVIALTLYAILPVLRNTIVGLEGVDRTLVEAGRGLGMSASSVLLRVELPLALPVIMAGLRVATVSTVALVTVGSIVSYGGLGNLMLRAVNTQFKAQILAASILCVALAVVLDLVLVTLQRALTPWTRHAR